MTRVTFAFLVVFGAPCSFCTCLAPKRSSALLNHHFRTFSYGNFARDANCHLGVIELKSFALDDPADCLLRCIGEPQPLSFNVAVHPDSGLCECDSLATDRYSLRVTSKDFQANDAFHHYSPWV